MESWQKYKNLKSIKGADRKSLISEVVGDDKCYSPHQHKFWRILRIKCINFSRINNVF